MYCIVCKLVALAQPPLGILSSVVWLSLPQRHVYRLLSISDSGGLEKRTPRGVTLRITFIEPDVTLARSQGPFVLAGWACASRCSANGLGGRRRQRVREHSRFLPSGQKRRLCFRTKAGDRCLWTRVTRWVFTQVWEIALVHGCSFGLVFLIYNDFNHAI